ncbi:Alginate lyase [Opitutaceae bacterium TAV1]|nr:Alginate lyase [Opitutaceae bacterium TAV1]
MKHAFIFSLFVSVVWPALLATAMSPDSKYTTIDVTPVWSGHPVGFALLTVQDHQFVACYDESRQMTVASRRLGEHQWSFRKLPTSVGWDSHNSIAMAADRDGVIHISGNMHNDPLIYFRTARPLDISSLEQVHAMTGKEETRVTYPRFFHDAAGTLIFSYRDGGSGKGDIYYNRYDEKTRAWSRLLEQPLFDGRGAMSAYPTTPEPGPDGRFHVIWVWRDSPLAETNHDLGYIRSHDLVHWETAGGIPVVLPVTHDTPGVTVDPVPVHGGLLNGQPRIGFDRSGRPLIAYTRYDAAGLTQLYLACFENDAWQTRQASRWETRIEISGRGSLPSTGLSIGAPHVVNGRLALEISHPAQGSGLFGINPVDWRLQGKIGQRDRSFAPAPLRKVESRFPDMRVKWANDSGTSSPGKSWRLRWETLPPNNDRPPPKPWPAPSMLRVVEFSEPTPAPVSANPVSPESILQPDPALVVPPLTRPHPRLLIDAAGLQTLRERVRTGQAPHAQAWQKLEARLARPVKIEPYTGTDGHRFFKVAMIQGGRARDLALAWRLTGRDDYANEAVEILLAWAKANPLPGTAFALPAGKAGKSPDWGMLAGRGLFPFLYACDLLADTPHLDASTQAVLATWFRAIIPVIKDCSRNWRENDWFNRQYYNNHLAAHAMGEMAIGIVLGDRELVQFAVSHPDNPRDFADLVASLILMPGDEQCPRDLPTVPAPETGEIYDRFRHNTAYGRGLQYSHLSMSLLGIMAEMGERNGLPLWSYTAPTGETVRLPFEYYADFHRLKDASIKSGYYAGETPRIGKAGDSPAMFELALARFPDNPSLLALMRAVDRERPAFLYELLGPVVLTHGVMLSPEK